MSNDLVKRLRELNTFEWHARPATTKEACFAAADRIEKLEAALAHIYAWYPVSVSHPAQTIEDIREFARKALEGKDDPQADL